MEYNSQRPHSAIGQLTPRPVCRHFFNLRLYGRFRLILEAGQVAFNEVDFCLRVKEAAYCHVWPPYAELIHRESLSRGAEDNPITHTRFQEEELKMQAGWGKKLVNEKSYNPNSTLGHEDFSLAWPPRVDHRPPRVGTC